jgi:hypothetical protein
LAAPRWTGFLQRGQTRRPASNLVTEGGDIAGVKSLTLAGGSPLDATERKPVVVGSEPSGRLTSAKCRAAHFSSWATSLASSSSVRASGSFSVGFNADVAFVLACAEVGTGTTRPQSGHLPATGRPSAGTFSRRPQGQRNLR